VIGAIESLGDDGGRNDFHQAIVDINLAGDGYNIAEGERVRGDSAARHSERMSIPRTVP